MRYLEPKTGEAVRTEIAKLVAQDGSSPPEAAGALLDLVGAMEADGHQPDDPIREVFIRLGHRWNMLLLLILKCGTFRHSTLRRLATVISRYHEISPQMLTLCLRALERDGFVARKRSAGRVPHVEYSLTPLGHGLLNEVERTFIWIRAHAGEIIAARDRFAEGEGPQSKAG